MAEYMKGQIKHKSKYPRAMAYFLSSMLGNSKLKPLPTKPNGQVLATIFRERIEKIRAAIGCEIVAIQKTHTYAHTLEFQ